MHCDYLNISIPSELCGDLVRRSFLSVMAHIGSRYSSDGSTEFWRAGATGTFRVSELPSGAILYGASGSALQALRNFGVFNDYLQVFSEHPHRVTKLDIAHDVEQDPILVLSALWQKAHRVPQGIRLTRKRINAKNIKRISRRDHLGRTTGSLYLGSRKSEAHAIVYDKRAERFDNTGVDIGHDLVRYELTVTSKLKISLADAYNPEPLFWHFMGDILSQPHSHSTWVPGGLGFELPPRVTPLPGEMLRRRVESSPELAEWFRLADEIGPKGQEYLQSLLMQRRSQYAAASLTEPEASQEASQGSGLAES